MVVSPSKERSNTHTTSPLVKSSAKKDLHKVKASKAGPEGYTISHRCGHEDMLCVDPAHLLIEKKKINDERVHCHFCLKAAFEFGGTDAVDTAIAIGVCPHAPSCAVATAV